MSVIAIVVALLLEQWRPLVERKTYHALLARWANWLEGTFNAGESRHGRIAWGVAAAPLALGSLVLHYALLWAHPFLALALNVIALYVTLGFRQFSHSFTGIQLAMKADDLDLARELIGKWRGEGAGHRTKEEVVRLAVEERAGFSPDGLIGMEANLRFPGPETMETKIFARLSAWQNWIFQRPNATGPEGALKLYGTGKQSKYDRKRA